MRRCKDQVRLISLVGISQYCSQWLEVLDLFAWGEKKTKEIIDDLSKYME